MKYGTSAKIVHSHLGPQDKIAAKIEYVLCDKMNLKVLAVRSLYNKVIDDAKNALPEELRESFEMYRHPAAKMNLVEFCDVLDHKAMSRYSLKWAKDEGCISAEDIDGEVYDDIYFDCFTDWDIEEKKIVPACSAGDHSNFPSTPSRIETSFFTDEEIEILHRENVVGPRKLGFIDPEDLY